MAMSLDGFITGPHDDAENPAGINGMRLMDWLEHPASRVRTGRTTAVAAARSGDRSDPDQPDRLRRGAGHRRGHHRHAAPADFAGYWGGDHHDGVQIFVPTH